MNRAGFISLMSVALLGSALGTAAMATDAQDHDAVEARLRGCVAAGAASAPKTALANAVQHDRALCGPQITDLAEIRAGVAAAGLSGEAAEEAKARALRELNNEIAFAVANFTGLTQ